MYLMRWAKFPALANAAEDGHNKSKMESRKWLSTYCSLTTCGPITNQLPITTYYLRLTTYHMELTTYHLQFISDGTQIQTKKRQT